MEHKNRRSSFENPTVLQDPTSTKKRTKNCRSQSWDSLSISDHLWAPHAAGRVSWKGTKWIFENSGLTPIPITSHQSHLPETFPRKISVRNFWAAGRVVPIDIDHGVQIHDANLGRDGFSCHHLIVIHQWAQWTRWTNGRGQRGHPKNKKKKQRCLPGLALEYNWFPADSSDVFDIVWWNATDASDWMSMKKSPARAPRIPCSGWAIARAGPKCWWPRSSDQYVLT